MRGQNPFCKGVISLSEHRLTSRQISETGLLIAIAVIIELVFRVLPRQPQGGSIDVTMLPLFIIAYRFGLKNGIVAGMIFGGINFLMSGLVLHWGSIFFDYILAFGVLGLAALFFKMNKESVVLFGTGIVVAGILRFLFHYLSGIIFFGEYAPEGTPVALYSFTYNITYMGPSILLTLLVGVLVFIRMREQLQAVE